MVWNTPAFIACVEQQPLLFVIPRQIILGFPFKDVINLNSPLDLSQSRVIIQRLNFGALWKLNPILPAN